MDWRKVVITDHHMPLMQGAEMVLEIRKMRPDARVLVVSNNTSADYPPGVSWLPKPFGVEALLSEVRGLCQ
jgi:DNA-binding NarL/FixJ family response regulator